MRGTGRAAAVAKNLGPLAHWKRDMKPDFQAVIKGLTVPTTCAAVFDNPSAAEQFVKRIKEEDLGMSVNISTSIEGAERCCNYACIDRHSVGYSLGFEGKTEKIPNSQVATLSTMCGHGMISHSLAKKMIDFVKENRRTPGAGSHLPVALLLLWYFQSVARKEDSRRCPDEFEIAVLSCLLLLFATSLVAEVKVLKNFTLIDGTGHAPVAHAAMIVDNGRIQWVGPAARLKAPPSAQVIDLQGKYVMPGIINLHVHLGTPSA